MQHRKRSSAHYVHLGESERDRWYQLKGILWRLSLTQTPLTSSHYSPLRLTFPPLLTNKESRRSHPNSKITRSPVSRLYPHLNWFPVTIKTLNCLQHGVGYSKIIKNVEQEHTWTALRPTMSALFPAYPSPILKPLKRHYRICLQHHLWWRVLGTHHFLWKKVCSAYLFLNLTALILTLVPLVFHISPWRKRFWVSTCALSCSWWTTLSPLFRLYFKDTA